MELEKGQKILVEHLEELLEEVESGEFGDFSNEKYPAPKIALVNKFIILIENTKKGIYD